MAVRCRRRLEPRLLKTNLSCYCLRVSCSRVFSFSSPKHIRPNATALIYKTINSDQFSDTQSLILAIHRYQRLIEKKEVA